MSDWQDRIVGARMTVDTEFADRVEASSFTRQEWGLVMTATEFDINDDGDPQLYADTEKLADIMPEVERVSEQSPMTAGGQQEQSSSGGVFGSLLSSLGLGGSSGPSLDEKVTEAEELTQGYARELQAHLEANGSWGEVLAAYRKETES
ncbi:hypothetical protein BRC72_01840 [Halobacteriales archaeon QH_7_66_36]|nr:MAG: hypothetical protein BRC72_01840 [Halobacteriales archaeon QH_7_66_36]